MSEGTLTDLDDGEQDMAVEDSVKQTDAAGRQEEPVAPQNARSVSGCH